MVFTIAITRKMAHEWSYWMLTEECITTELSFSSSINTFTSLSIPDMIAFINLEVRLQLLTVAQLNRGWTQEKFCVHPYCFRRLMGNLLIKMEHFDWLSTVQGIHCTFVTDLSLTWSPSFSLKASKFQRSLYWSLKELKGWMATTLAISLTSNIAVFLFFLKIVGYSATDHELYFLTLFHHLSFQLFQNLFGWPRALLFDTISSFVISIISKFVWYLF